MDVVSQSEIDRCDAVIRNVRRAVSESAKLRELKVQVILQGSYRNNINVKRDSDVDVGIVCAEPFFPFYPQGTDAGRSTASPKVGFFSSMVTNWSPAGVRYYTKQIHSPRWAAAGKSQLTKQIKTG